MVRRMDHMWKGDRVVPPCDRCRRLHMDCLKNLTACMGCTKKHAKCSWKEVQASEMHMAAPLTTTEREEGEAPNPGNPAPLPVPSAVEASRPSDDVLSVADIARASLSATGDRPETAKDDGLEGTVLVDEAEPAARTNSSARFDVRPPPLVQQLQDAVRDLPAGGPSSFASPFSPREKERNDDDHDDSEKDKDDGDRLEALAARVFRTSSQSAYRS